MNFKILGIEHIGIAQSSSDSELSSFLKNILNLSKNTEIVDDQKVLTEIFDTGSGKIELLSATEPESVITKYLAKKGQSAHHIALLGDNLEEALKYLKSRGVSQDDMIKYSIGYCEDGLYSNRIIIPSYDNEGQLNFFIGRDIFDSKLKYRNSPTPKDIVGFELFVNWEEPILLVEGALDAITSKVNSIPLFGKTIMNNLKRKILEKKVKTLYVALDNDAVKDSMKIVEELMNEGIKVHMIKLTEKDPNDIGYEKFTDIKNSTNETSFRELVKYKLGMI